MDLRLDARKPHGGHADKLRTAGRGLPCRRRKSDSHGSFRMKPHTWKLLGGSARVKRLLGRAMSQTQQASRFNGELHAVLIASGACSVANKESALR